MIPPPRRPIPTAKRTRPSLEPKCHRLSFVEYVFILFLDREPALQKWLTEPSLGRLFECIGTLVRESHLRTKFSSRRRGLVFVECFCFAHQLDDRAGPELHDRFQLDRNTPLDLLELVTLLCVCSIGALQVL